MNADQSTSSWFRFRRRTAEVLFSVNSQDPLTHRVDIALIVLIFLNVLAVALESMESVYQAWENWFTAFEIFSVAIFTVEYALRAWSVVDNPWIKVKPRDLIARLRYMRTWMAIIDLAAIAPFYLSFIVGVDLRFLRIMRLLRVFKLTRYSSAMNLLIQVLREEARTIGAAMFVLAMLVVVASSLAFIFEQGANPAKPDAFASIPAAMYWAVITMTTVGYGDVVPVTVPGKIISALIGVVGMGMFALPAGILASGFSNALRRRRKELEEHVEDALADGVISAAEEDELNELVQRLNLNPADEKAILEIATHKFKSPPGVCPHCHKPLLAPDHDF